MKGKYSLGLDIGSTTIKAVALDESGKVVFTSYERHNAKVREALESLLVWPSVAICLSCRKSSRRPTIYAANMATSPR